MRRFMTVCCFTFFTLLLCCFNVRTWTAGQNQPFGYQTDFWCVGWPGIIEVSRYEGFADDYWCLHLGKYGPNGSLRYYRQYYYRPYGHPPNKHPKAHERPLKYQGKMHY